MNVTVGTYSLSGAVLVAACTLFAAIVAGKSQSRGLLIAAKAGLGLFAGLLTVSSIALMIALTDSDFSVAYVQSYTEKALPIGYKIAAFWAGQEGSLLLWAWLLAVISLVAALLYRNETVEAGAVFVGTLTTVCGFFAVLMLFAANPFGLAEAVAADGHGLNPMLQDPGMIAHPPLLFLGYAGFTVPFALMMAALVTGKTDNTWVVQTRRWSIVSWLFLSIGIILGAQWAYVELGWGGYWAWDPVENASLLPWLTATALLHSIMIQQHRGTLKVWNVSLIAMTFILCIFGTFLTRSGVVQSVHSFGKSWVGTFFLIFLIFSIVVSAAVIVWRLKLLRPENAIEHMLGREGAFLITNVLLFGMMAVTLVGTIFPLLSGPFMDQPMSVSQPFYNSIVVPLGVVLVGLMAVGPLLMYGSDGSRRLGRGLIVPGIGAGIVIAVMCVMRIFDPWALVCGAIVTVGVLTALIDLGQVAIERSKNAGENPVAALVRVLDGNHRRYGGQVVHMGMLMIMAGVAGSSLFNEKLTLQLKPNETAKVGKYTLQYETLTETRHENYTAVEATLHLMDPSGVVSTLKPQRRFYDKFEQYNTEVAIQSSLREDLYTTLAGWEEGGKLTAIQAIVNPLVSWIWIGGIVMSLGAIVCLMPRLLPVRGEAGEENGRAAEAAPTRGRPVAVGGSK